MASDQTPQTRLQYWRRVLRPLYWWLVLVLCMYGYRQHQKWVAQTSLEFSITLNGKSVGYDAETRLDGGTIYSGRLISLGRHSFTVTHSKGVGFTTNFFCWYGGRDLGEINLKRKTGSLVVQATPPADTIAITGPEFSLTLSNNSGTNFTVPTDVYQVQTDYRYLSHADKVTVSDSAAGVCTIAPEFGALHLIGNHEGETYELQDTNGQSVESGTLPTTLIQLPVDHYLVKAKYHNRTIEQSAVVARDITNIISLDFVLGAARFETMPSGAEVHRNGGAVLGKTPLVVSDMSPQMAEFDLTLLGYQTVSLAIAIAADRTNTCRTNLINIRYESAMKEAREYQIATNFGGVVRATREALFVVPDDLEALDMQMAANSQLSVQRQRADAAQQEAARKAEVGREQQKQLTRPSEVFEVLCRDTPDSNLFDEHELITSKPAKDVEAAILKSLTTSPGAYKIEAENSPQPKTYAVTARNSFSLGILGGSESVLLLVVGQTKDDETKILVKLLQFEVNHTYVAENLTIHDQKKYVPMHPSRMQMSEIGIMQAQGNVRAVTERIRGAIKGVQ